MRSIQPASNNMNDFLEWNVIFLDPIVAVFLILSPLKKLTSFCKTLENFRNDLSLPTDVHKLNS